MTEREAIVRFPRLRKAGECPHGVNWQTRCFECKPAREHMKEEG